MKNKDSKWELVQKTVAVLEQALAPDARVEQDVWLPELATGTLRQCDAVVYAGKEPRITTTIVEVQERTSRVEVGTYEGWCKKREKLGAQHLICVSATGFPQSIEADAKLQGDTVRLMTLLEPGEKPPFIKQAEFFYEIDTLEYYDTVIAFDRPPAPQGIKNDARVWLEAGSQSPRSMVEIIDSRRRSGQVESVSRVEDKMRGDGTLTYAIVYDMRFAPPLVLSKEASGFENSTDLVHVREVYTHERINLLQEVRAYEQRNFDGVLGWVVFAEADRKSEKLRITMVGIPEGDGIRFNSISCTRPNAPGTTLLGPMRMMMVVSTPKKQTE